jgi:hypothetical protein
VSLPVPVKYYTAILNYNIRANICFSISQYLGKYLSALFDEKMGG